MRIVTLGSVALPVPPPMQGGTERIAYAQAIGLAKKGHEVILVAAKGSKSSPDYSLVEIGAGDTVGSSKESFVESSRNLRREMLYLSQVTSWLETHANEYDLVLNNMRGGEILFHLIARNHKKKYATVMHLPIFAELYDSFQTLGTPVVTISNAQRRDFPNLNYVGTVYNGVDIADFPFEPAVGNYLLMMGSITPHKNQKTAISVAKTLGMTLVMAGKVGNPAYYAKEIAPHIDGKTVIHHGEVSMEEKVKLYGAARALLFPVLWEEPFGLVMIEAMACGTPVIAFRRGAVPEVVDSGKTGFIVDNEAQMIEATKKIKEIDRAACRKHVEEHFTNDQMIFKLDHVLAGV